MLVHVHVHVDVTVSVDMSVVVAKVVPASDLGFDVGVCVRLG